MKNQITMTTRDLDLTPTMIDFYNSKVFTFMSPSSQELAAECMQFLMNRCGYYNPHLKQRNYKIDAETHLDEHVFVKKGVPHGGTYVQFKHKFTVHCADNEFQFAMEFNLEKPALDLGIETNKQSLPTYIDTDIDYNRSKGGAIMDVSLFHYLRSLLLELSSNAEVINMGVDPKNIVQYAYQFILNKENNESVTILIKNTSTGRLLEQHTQEESHA